MKKFIIGQLVVTAIILAVFFIILFLKKGDIKISLLFAGFAAAGFAGAAFLGVFARYVIGASAAIFICAIYVDPVITAPLAIASTVAAFFCATHHEKTQAARKSLWLPNVIQFIIVLTSIGKTVAG